MNAVSELGSNYEPLDLELQVTIFQALLDFEPLDFGWKPEIHKAQ